jgi:hypothetical protein
MTSMLGASDIYVLAGALSDGSPATLREFAATLAVDHTLVHRALKRAEAAGLYSTASKQVDRASFEELVVHAARFIVPARLGELTRGVQAAWATEPISTRIRQSSSEPPPVWPDARGEVRGQTLQPLHPAAIPACRENPELRRLLAIIDSIRAGDARVRKVAADALHDELRHTLSRTAT